MAVIIHIQEVNSTQVTEIIAPTLEEAITAYAMNATCNAYMHSNPGVNNYKLAPNTVRWIGFPFREELLIVSHIYGQRYLAEWLPW